MRGDLLLALAMSLSESQSKEDGASLEVLLRRLANPKSHVNGLKEWMHARLEVLCEMANVLMLSERFLMKSMRRSC